MQFQSISMTTITVLGFLFFLAAKAAPGGLDKRSLYYYGDPGSDTVIISTETTTSFALYYGSTPSIVSSAIATGLVPSISDSITAVSSWLPTCSDWVPCYTCTAGYLCPTPTSSSTLSITDGQSTLLTYPSSWESTLVIKPTCYDWKACSACRGGYRCPKPVESSALAVTMSSFAAVASQTITPTCPGWQYCYDCVGGYTCPTSTLPLSWTSLSSTDPVASIVTATPYLPTCSDYVVCPECSLGYLCPSTTSTASPVITSQPAAYIPSCSDYVVCPTCVLGYSCPISSTLASSWIIKSPLTLTPSSFVIYPSSAKILTSPTSNALRSTGIVSPSSPSGYGQPTCSNYVVCPSCSLGYYCPTVIKTSMSTIPIYLTQSTSSMSTDPGVEISQIYGFPTCSNYVVCPTCALGYDCPILQTVVTTNPTSNTATSMEIASGNYYNYGSVHTNSNYPTLSSSQLAISSAFNYFPTQTTMTTMVAGTPTCPDYVLCPTCAYGYYCPSVSPTQTSDGLYPYSYTAPANTTSQYPITAAPSIPISGSSTSIPCDVYVFCPECDSGYYCLMRSSTTLAANAQQSYQAQKSNAWISMLMPSSGSPYIVASQPIDTTSTVATIPTVYSLPDTPGNSYSTPASAAVSAPAVPTCASYIVCPTCPLGYSCISTVEATFASATKYGYVPTGIIDTVVSVATVMPSNEVCPSQGNIVTVTITQDIIHYYNTCGADSDVWTSMVIPTITETVNTCDPGYTSVTPVNPYLWITNSVSVNCKTCTLAKYTDASPPLPEITSSPLMTTDPYSAITSFDSSSTCSFKPCDGGYACETCPHKWYCPPERTPTYY